ncbi:hypothetical protein [Maribacter stanieri]|uniref:Tellurite resistance protein TerB n=1 Tax=Maribacter stanieri TaxID=440514 RepID=A0A1I6IHS6_9FLAO|nr:hypothetical protein [Maribacter stanieri]SFR66199.1 hypothetical protein SAMN04488010_1748 [Maribacter stanieri]
MENTYQIKSELYKSLGKLFYAVAICDGSVYLKEWDKVEEMVKKYWRKVDDFKDSSGTALADQIEVVFDWLLEYEKTSDECFEEFREFYEKNPQVFTKKIKSLIKKTTKAIANSLLKKKKSEKKILKRIDLLLK